MQNTQILGALRDGLWATHRKSWFWVSCSDFDNPDQSSISVSQNFLWVSGTVYT